MARKHRDPGRKPTVVTSGRVLEDDDDGQFTTSAGKGRMVGSVLPPERTEEEIAEPMPALTKPLRTASPS
jgi:hypothetical protein